MALIGTIAINAKVNTAPLAKGLKGAAGMVQSFSASVMHTGLGLKELFAGAAAFGAAKGIAGMIKSASDLTETTSKLQGTFGSASQGIIDEANRMNLAFGTSKVEFLDATAVLGGLFKNMGYTADQASVLSISMVKLADDVSSRFNIGFDEAFQKLRAGISGESEPLKALGVLMDEAAVKAEAMKMGIGGAGKELSQSEKVQARLAIITRQLADAQGDHARTADEVAGALRGISGRVEGLAQAIGEALLPIAKSALGEMNTAVQALSLYWEDNKAGVVAWGQSTVGAVGESARSMGVLQTAIGYVADGWQWMTTVFDGVRAVITTGLSTIVKGLSYVGSAIDYALEKITGLKAGIGDFLKIYGEDLDRLGKEQLKQFFTDLSKPPAHEGINAYFDQAAQKIQAVRKEVAKTGPDISKIKPANMEEKTVAPKFASAAAAGSKEAANAILRSRYGAALTSKGPQEQTARNTSQMVELLKKIASGQSSPQGAAAVSTTAALAINL